METKTRSVAAIKNGTVIDHIPPGQAIKLIQLLGLNHYSETVACGMNLRSKGMGRKDVLKIEDKELIESEMHQIAVFAPEATISIIRDYLIAWKSSPDMPEEIEHFVECSNSRCITNHEGITSQFTVENLGSHTYLTCRYCGQTQSELELNLRD